jgi:uncharacterized protein DUF2852
MSYAAQADDHRSPGPWCAQSNRHGFWSPGMVILLVLGFIFWWPVGLAILAYILWSKGCWSHGGAHWQEKMDRMRNKMERFGGAFGGRPSSGNHAFDDYRAETLKRLEDEEKEFRDFLDRLRAAKDKAEFDQFMADRRARGGTATQPPQAQV